MAHREDPSTRVVIVVSSVLGVVVVAAVAVALWLVFGGERPRKGGDLSAPAALAAQGQRTASTSEKSGVPSGWSVPSPPPVVEPDHRSHRRRARRPNRGSGSRTNRTGSSQSSNTSGAERASPSRDSSKAQPCRQGPASGSASQASETAQTASSSSPGSPSVVGEESPGEAGLEATRVSQASPGLGPADVSPAAEGPDKAKGNPGNASQLAPQGQAHESPESDGEVVPPRRATVRDEQPDAEQRTGRAPSPKQSATPVHQQQSKEKSIPLPKNVYLVTLEGLKDGYKVEWWVNGEVSQPQKEGQAYKVKGDFKIQIRGEDGPKTRLIKVEDACFPQPRSGCRLFAPKLIENFKYRPRRGFR